MYLCKSDCVFEVTHVLFCCILSTLKYDDPVMFSLFEFNVDLAVEYVKNIYENILCPVCDKPDVPRMRFFCGHSLCENCFNSSVGCYTCLSPSEPSASTKPECDTVLTQRVNNVSHLINTFKETFNIDVYERKRLSEYLKREKQLFPQCIQAPQTYYNKRKSFNKLCTGKENYRFKFLGEDTSPVKINKMEHSVNYVKNWLNKNDSSQKRKPLADINVENANIKRKLATPNTKGNSTLNIRGAENNQRKYKKRSYKTANSLVGSKNTLDKFLNGKTKKDFEDVPIKSHKECYTTEIKSIGNVQDKDESGIVTDYDSFILIEDSQTSVDYEKTLLNSTVDKDREALLQVLEASKCEQNSVVNRTPPSKVEILQTNEMGNEFSQQYKVPYYKRSYLKENCHLCSKNTTYVQDKVKYKSKDSSKDVCVTIESNSFTATIMVTNNIENVKKHNEKISIPVQTDIVDISYRDKDVENSLFKNINLHNRPLLVTKSTHLNSQELFTSEEVPDNINRNNFNNLGTGFDKEKNVIIEESDSSEDMEESRVLEVTADIHRSCEQFEYDILTEIENTEEHTRRSRRRPRGYTPDSSNSSDKENFDPNRSKRLKHTKKTCYKK